MVRMSNNDLLPQSALQIKQDDKFFSRLLAKENSAANTSFRVYYGLAPGPVPFLWESQPGKPKNPITSATIPPLTPPPSYIVNGNDKDKAKRSSSKNSSSILLAILPKVLSLRRTHRHSSSMSSSLSSSSFSSAWSLPSSPGRRSCHLPGSRSSCSLKEDDEPDSPTSILCFKLKRSNGQRSLRWVGDKVPVKKSESSPKLQQLGHGSS